MADIAWSFIGSAFASRAEFEKELVEAQDHGGFDSSELVVLASAVRVEYVVWEGDEQVEKVVALEADDGLSFSSGELMFKLHNAVVAGVSEQDHHFFEGLMPVKGSGSPPLYRLWLGS